MLSTLHVKKAFHNNLARQLRLAGNNLFQFVTVHFKTGRQVDLHDRDIFRLARVERHVRLEEHVVLLEIRLRYFRRSNRVVRHVVCFHNRFDRFRVNRPALFEQALDRRFHTRLALAGSQV
jgi:hypothetical protein